MPMPVSVMVSVRAALSKDAHFQLGLIAVEAGVAQRFKAQLVASIRSIGDQLAQEDFLVGIQRMRDQVQQLGHFGLEGMGLLCHVFVSEKLKIKSRPEVLSRRFAVIARACP
jgi:hypothetical protein